MEKEIKIYQIEDVAGTVFAFRDYDKAHFDLSAYKKVATLDFASHKPSVEGWLDDIFEALNEDPADGMRSLSISDIVEIDGKLWYVNNCGYTCVGVVA